jgi:hypothetical protein
MVVSPPEVEEVPCTSTMWRFPENLGYAQIIHFKSFQLDVP